ncbi:flp operon protein C [Bisgaard Taxon 45]|uniref:Flp operon protein C n=1 Tax=Bisgaard Taxon 45 TaxID=304289 RepID=A0ABT9KFX8_9PAST|nr:flp operon protein C [Bisgaard Taxon 45]
MNYRTLFIISFLTLAIGIAGILFLPTDGDNTLAVDSSGQVISEEKPKKQIVLVELKKDIAKGTLLQSDDYVFSEITVVEDNPLVTNDLKDVILAAPSKSLQGYLVSENVKSGSLLSPDFIVAPNDPRFLLANLDSRQEVAFRVYLRPDERYLLDSVKVGDSVSVYNQKIATGEDNNHERSELVRLSDKLLVLQVKEFLEDDQNQGTYSEYRRKDYIGFVSLKANVEQVKHFYSLDKESKLIVLPADEKSTNHRGLFIRKLRGQ